MKLYQHECWKSYCAEQIKLHGDVCAHCLRTKGDVILQVQHLVYIKGRMPWEYAFDECVVLCRGCHAKVHGIIKPSKDWELIGEDDLGALDGECEHCGTALRYTHMITHLNWGVMIVGAQCADKLTESTVGSECHADFLNYVNRRKAFVDSPKWQLCSNGERSIIRAGIVVTIVPADDSKFRVSLEGVVGRIDHATLLDAQISAFDVIESGEAETYLASRRRKLRENRDNTHLR